MENDEIALLFIIIAVSYAGYKMRFLTLSGAIGAVIIGASITIGFGTRGLILLGVFFLSSSLWSKFEIKKKELLKDKVQKGAQRDIIQVLANGAIPAIISLIYVAYPSTTWLLLFIVAISAANSDTWASELGSLSRKKPLLLTRIKIVDHGTSGAVSLLGSIAALAGAAVIVIAAIFLWGNLSYPEFILLLLSGFSGNLVDSVLGGTIQVTYKCKSCGLITEKLVHCGMKTSYHNGIVGINNDVVNFLAIFLSVCLAGLVIYIYY